MVDWLTPRIVGSALPFDRGDWEPVEEEGSEVGGRGEGRRRGGGRYATLTDTLANFPEGNSRGSVVWSSRDDGGCLLTGRLLDNGAQDYSGTIDTRRFG